MDSPVSILFPCYQINTWLLDALESIEVAGRKLKSECVIIANNMSPVALVELKKICSEILTINYIIEDAGETNLVGALNLGIQKCSYNLIARMDQDDLMLPERLLTQRNYLDSNPSIAILGGATQVIDEGGKYIFTQTYPLTPDQIKKQITRGNCFAHPAVMYRKDAVSKVGLYRDIYTHAEDFDLFIRLSKEYECSNLDFPVIKYRLNTNQVSHRFRKEQIISTRSLIILQGLDDMFSIMKLPIPRSHGELSNFLQKIRIYSLKLLFSFNQVDRKNALRLRQLMAVSHFAIARSSGAKNNRRWITVSKHLTFAFFLSPTELLKQIRISL
jgi:glycosyltransferase involved in cell wall biosynthesis